MNTETSDKMFNELFVKPAKSFDYHLSLPDNNRILFSGKFGTGKTTFLEHYFSSKSEQYNTVHLFPVNYSVAENEDIFKYIKYDIIRELYWSNEENVKSFSTEIDGFGNFFAKNFIKILATSSLLIPLYGDQLNTFAKQVDELNKELRNSLSNEDQKENNEVISLFKEIMDKEGSIYESNFITVIIQRWLRQINKNGKENVLIIDDLDRVAPSQIFRILNVFSAHIDSKIEGYNKFGFSKIILVCDIMNLRDLFKYRFGVEDSFLGYIDKFYSATIHHFDNKDDVYGIIEKIVYSITFSGEINLSSDISKTNIRQHLTRILEGFISNNLISLRQLIRFYNKTIPIEDLIIIIKGIPFHLSQNPLLISIYLIKLILGDEFILREKVRQVKEFKILIDENLSVIGDYILLGHPEKIVKLHNKEVKGNRFINLSFRVSLSLSYRVELIYIYPDKSNPIGFAKVSEIKNSNSIIYPRPSKLDSSYINLVYGFKNLVNEIEF